MLWVYRQRQLVTSGRVDCVVEVDVVLSASRLDVHRRRTALTTAINRRPSAHRPRTVSWNALDRDVDELTSTSSTSSAFSSDGWQVLLTSSSTSSSSSFCSHPHTHMIATVTSFRSVIKLASKYVLRNLTLYIHYSGNLVRPHNGGH